MEYDVEIRASGIPEVNGYGLFATRSFSKGELVCTMAGRLLTESQFTREYPRRRDRIYITQMAERKIHGVDLYLDSSDPRSCYGRYINSLTPKQKRKYKVGFNVYFAGSSDPTRSTAFDIVALRKIKAGEELFVDYGPDYVLPSD